MYQTETFIQHLSLKGGAGGTQRIYSPSEILQSWRIFIFLHLIGRYCKFHLITFILELEFYSTWYKCNCWQVKPQVVELLRLLHSRPMAGGGACQGCQRELVWCEQQRLNCSALVGGFLLRLFRSADQRRNETRKREEKPPEPVTLVSMVTDIEHSTFLFFCSASSLEPFVYCLSDMLSVRSSERYISKRGFKKCCFIITTVCVSVERDLCWCGRSSGAAGAQHGRSRGAARAQLGRSSGAARTSLLVISCCLQGVNSAAFWTDSGGENMMQRPLSVADCSLSSVWCVEATKKGRRKVTTLGFFLFPVVHTACATSVLRKLVRQEETMGIRRKNVNNMDREDSTRHLLQSFILHHSSYIFLIYYDDSKRLNLTVFIKIIHVFFDWNKTKKLRILVDWNITK